ncbi:MAG: pyridoxal-phosphate dependent enzyme [Anaerolineae bacterium]|nr:pyridoxal-phosphate dependent enzyme [Anaerolineae bacterium]
MDLTSVLARWPGVALPLIEAAQSRVAPYVRPTPLAPAPPLRGDLAPHLTLKLENLQVTGSFKARGAFNNLLQLDAAARERGIVAASGGNHGLAVAYAAHRLGLPATIFIPATAAPDRAARIAAWGVRLIQVGESYDEAEAAATRFARDEGLPNIHPFDSDGTLQGTGTLGLELLDDIPDADLVLIAIGGGGLIAGMSAALKQRRPDLRIVGHRGGRRTLHDGQPGSGPRGGLRTIATTLAPRAVSQRTLDLTRACVDEIVLVTDTEMVAAMRWLWAECNQLVEPSGAAVIAALQTGRVDLIGCRRPVALVCGGNAAADPVFDAYASQISD